MKLSAILLWAIFTSCLAGTIQDDELRPTEIFLPNEEKIIETNNYSISLIPLDEVLNIKLNDKGLETQTHFALSPFYRLDDTSISKLYIIKICENNTLVVELSTYLDEDRAYLFEKEEGNKLDALIINHDYTGGYMINDLTEGGTITRLAEKHKAGELICEEGNLTLTLQ